MTTSRWIAGVETPAMLAAVRAAGCRLAQGYLLGRPVPLDQVRHSVLAGVLDPRDVREAEHGTG